MSTSNRGRFTWASGTRGAAGSGAAGRVGDHNFLNFSSRGAPDVLTCLPKFFPEPIPQFGIDEEKEYARLQEATLVNRPCIPNQGGAILARAAYA